MGRGSRWAYVFLAATVRAASAAACDVPDVSAALMRVEGAERAHAVGEAIGLRTRLLGCPLGDRGVDNVLALSRDHAAVGDYARAAEVAETFGEYEVEQANRPSLRPIDLGDPRVRAAMAEAFDARLALRDLDDARSDVQWLLRAEGATEANVERAMALGAAWEGARAWPTALQWYRHLASSYGGWAQWRTSVRALAGMARAYDELGANDLAVRSWEALLERWPVARATWPPLRALRFSPWRLPGAAPVPPRVTPTRDAAGPLLRLQDGRVLRPVVLAAGGTGGADGVVSPFGGMTEAGVNNANLNAPFPADDPYLDCFAEARFRLAQEAARRVLADTAPLYTGPPDRGAYDLWIAHVFTPWDARRTDRLRRQLTAQFTDVVNLHVPRWEIAAYAVLASSHFDFARQLRELPAPEYQWRRRWLRDFFNVLR